MSRRRRAALLLGLALVLGALAAADVGRREAALRAQVGPAVEVLVARTSLLVGQRLAVDVPAGAPLDQHLLERAALTAGPALRRGERAAEVVARASPTLVVAGVRVDVVVTGEHRTELALADVEVLAARPVREAEQGPQVAATLRVTVRQAVYLAAASAYASAIRLLVRAPGDRGSSVRSEVGTDLTMP